MYIFAKILRTTFTLYVVQRYCMIMETVILLLKFSLFSIH